MNEFDLKTVTVVPRGNVLLLSVQNDSMVNKLFVLQLKYYSIIHQGCVKLFHFFFCCCFIVIFFFQLVK